MFFGDFREVEEAALGINGVVFLAEMGGQGVVVIEGENEARIGVPLFEEGEWIWVVAEQEILNGMLESAIPALTHARSVERRAAVVGRRELHPLGRRDDWVVGRRVGHGRTQGIIFFGTFQNMSCQNRGFRSKFHAHAER